MRLEKQARLISQAGVDSRRGYLRFGIVRGKCIWPSAIFRIDGRGMELSWDADEPLCRRTSPLLDLWNPPDVVDAGGAVPYAGDPALQPLRRSFRPDELMPELKAAGVHCTVTIAAADGLVENCLANARVHDSMGLVGWVPHADPSQAERVLDERTEELLQNLRQNGPIRVRLRSIRRFRTGDRGCSGDDQPGPRDLLKGFCRYRLSFSWGVISRKLRVQAAPGARQPFRYPHGVAL